MKTLSSYIFYSIDSSFKFNRIENNVIKRNKSIFLQMLSILNPEELKVNNRVNDLHTQFLSLISLETTESRGLLETSKLPDNIEIFNMEGSLSGYIKEFYNNTLFYKANYLNGKLDGEVTEYYSNGEIKSISNYKNGYLHGKFVIPAKEDNVGIDCNYYYGMLHGKEIKLDKLYYKFTNNYKYGQLEGLSTVHNPDKECVSIEHYKNGKKHGWRLWHTEKESIDKMPISHLSKYNNGEQFCSVMFLDSNDLKIKD